MEGDARRTDQDAARRIRDRDEPVLPDVPRDETSEGWGERDERRDEQWYREQRPPHWE
ncbi:MAG: hypothetical protein ACTHMS_07975 [Jatrophihabitans sp.]|uniref:hypothetical protein n=1 Tax=Jatrophihabitans sp. TaxID=1932789 RepID=UPI003F7EA8E6